MQACGKHALTRPRGRTITNPAQKNSLKEGKRCQPIRRAGGMEGGLSEQQAMQYIQSAMSGSMSATEAARAMAAYATGMQQVSDFAKLDGHRMDRTGLPEAVWGPGKTPVQIATILQALTKTQRTALATRIEPHVYESIRTMLPDARYWDVSRIVTLAAKDTSGLPPKARLAGTVAVVTAGTADLAVAEECRLVAEHMGCYVFKVTDVGVAGLHRVLSNLSALRAADVVIVVAGMDGALPSVVAGLVQAPVIAVPTSVGYGAAFSGLAPLLSTLNSCSPGISVVNIDNGFGAAMMAARMLQMAARLHNKRNGKAATDDIPAAQAVSANGVHKA